MTLQRGHAHRARNIFLLSHCTCIRIKGTEIKMPTYTFVFLSLILILWSSLFLSLFIKKSLKKLSTTQFYTFENHAHSPFEYVELQFDCRMARRPYTSADVPGSGLQRQAPRGLLDHHRGQGSRDEDQETKPLRDNR